MPVINSTTSQYNFFILFYTPGLYTGIGGGGTLYIISLMLVSILIMQITVILTNDRAKRHNDIISRMSPVCPFENFETMSTDKNASTQAEFTSNNNIPTIVINVLVLDMLITIKI